MGIECQVEEGSMANTNYPYQQGGFKQPSSVSNPQVTGAPRAPSYRPKVFEEPKARRSLLRILLVISLSILLFGVGAPFAVKLVSEIWKGVGVSGSPPVALFPTEDSWHLFCWIVGLGILGIVIGRVLRHILRGFEKDE